MNTEQIKEQFHILTINLKKYRYPVLILAIGILFMLFPGKSDRGSTEDRVEYKNLDENLEERLELILSQIDGAGKVKVLLTMKTGPEETYLENIRSISSEQQNETEKELVTVRDQSGAERPISVKTSYPVYKGAVVVCQGANRATVKLDIIRAVSSLTGLGSDKITVIKMKGN